MRRPLAMNRTLASRSIAGALLLALAATIACGSASAPDPNAAAAPPIARIHKAKCGQCHKRVEPGLRTRVQLEDAFTRHRKRVHLTEEQWAQMVDYLAIPDSAGAAPAPAPPSAP